MIEDIKKTRWATADKLRANMDTAEYKHILLDLILVKYISDTLQTGHADFTRKFTDSQDDYYLGDVDAEQVSQELEAKGYFKKKFMRSWCLKPPAGKASNKYAGLKTNKGLPKSLKLNLYFYQTHSKCPKTITNRRITYSMPNP